MTDPVLSDGTASFTPSGEVRGGVKTTFHSSLKNDDVQTSSSQVIGAAKVFDAFGNELSSTGAWKSQFGYAGKFGYQGDADSGLKLLGHRYYDSSTGRILTRDPIKDGRNWYGYGAGYQTPIANADPSGLFVTTAIVVSAIGLTVWGAIELGKKIDELFNKHRNRKNVQQPEAFEDIASETSTEDETDSAVNRERNRIQEGNRETGDFARDQFESIYIRGPLARAGGAVASGGIGIGHELPSEEIVAVDTLAQSVAAILFRANDAIQGRINGGGRRDYPR